MKTTLRLGWLKVIQHGFIGFAILLLIGAYSPMTQADPKFDLKGQAAWRGQLVEVGQQINIDNGDGTVTPATVVTSFAEIFLDIGTGAVEGTIHLVLNSTSNRVCLDTAIAVTGGTFSTQTKEFNAFSTVRCGDIALPPGNGVCGHLDDDKTISIYDGFVCSGTLLARVSSDVPINLCSAGSTTTAASEHRISTNAVQPPQCFDPPSITALGFSKVWLVEEKTTVTVSFRNPGRRDSLTVSVGRSDREIEELITFNVGGKENGNLPLNLTCGLLGRIDIIFTISNTDGQSKDVNDFFTCALAHFGPPSVGTQPTLTKKQKDALTRAADAAEIVAVNAFFAFLICEQALSAEEICDPIFELADILLGGAERKRKLAADPPDPNFTEIAQPITPPITPITTNDPSLQKLIDAQNALLLNQAQTIGLEEALLHAMERAQGAFEAHDAYWQFKQLAAAAQFASQLATLLKAQKALSSAIPKEWKAAGLPNLSPSADDVAKLQTSLSTQGFPKEVLAVFTQLNIDQATIDQLKQQLLAQPPQALAGSYPDKLNDSKFNSALKGVASGLTKLASQSCKVNASAELSFVRFDEDVARFFAFLPDGKKDGHFRLTLTRPDSSKLVYLKLETADTNNRPAFSQVWDTDLNTDWMLGLEDAKGKKLNATDKKISVSVNGTATFELFANDSGYFKTGQHFIVTALFKDGCVAQASVVIPQGVGPQPALLKVDDGSYELVVGFPTGTATAYFVNRLTPPSYPATLKNIQIHFTNRANGLKQNDAIKVLVGTNPSGGTNIDSVTFQQISAKVIALDSFNQYGTPAVTINSGDFVVGFLTNNPQNIFPMDEDTTAPSKQRSYLSSNGVNFSLVDSFANLAGNFAIRATVSVPSGAPAACFSIMIPAESMGTFSSPELAHFAPMPAGVSTVNKNDITEKVSRAAGVCDTVAALLSDSALTSPLIDGIEVRSEADKLILETSGSEIASLHFMLFDLSGRKLLDRTSQSPVLTLPAAMDDSAPLANGVYLYVMDVRGYSGKLIRSELRKLIISR